MRSIFARAVRYGAIAALPTAMLLFPGAASASSRPTLQEGSRGHWVDVLQQDLTDIGYALPVTGDYGTNTRAKVVAFKKSRRLTPNGVVASRTWHQLRSAVKYVRTRPWRRAHLNSRGLAVAPRDAPIVVKRAIAAANRIAFTPYCYGGGHGSWKSSCYDCSGSVSYALHGAGLLWAPLAFFGSYDAGGRGKWFTIYTNHSHAYMSIAGLWFDTADQQWGSYGHGDRWSTKRVDPASGYWVRHPNHF